MKVVSVVGNRPQFIKAAPLAAAPAAVSAHVLVHTGQHYDAELSQVFFDELGLAPPGHEIEAGSGTHAVQTPAMLTGLQPRPTAQRPHPRRAPAARCSPAAHAPPAGGARVGGAAARPPAPAGVSGLRSFDRAMPEEVN